METEDIFINAQGRLRSGWRLAIYALLLFFSIEVLFQILRASAIPALEGLWGYVVQGLILLVPATLLGWGCNKFLEELPPRALGWGFHKGWLRDFLFGSLVGALSLLLAASIPAATGGLKFTLNSTVAFATIGRTLLTSLPIFLLAAAGEEAMFRGYGLQTMTRARLAWVAIIITSVIFSWGHLDNPNVIPGFTFANTAIAGVWFAVAYLKTRSLWLPFGLHWAWNWMMAAVLGIPVSGVTVLTPEPLWRATDLGPAWLTGGLYGLEGGAACTIALLLSTLFIWRTRLVGPTEEMKALTDRENPRQLPQPQSIF